MLPMPQINLLILNVGTTIHNADWNWKDVCSPFARLYYVTKGKAQIVFPSKTHDLKPHHLYFIPPFVLHSYKCNSYFEHYYLHLYENSQLETNLLHNWDFPVELPANEIDLNLFKRLCELNPTMKLPQSNPASYDNDTTLIQNIQRSEQLDLAIKVESTGIIYQLISRFLRKARPQAGAEDYRIKKVLAYIQKNMHEPIDIEMLSGLSCLSKDHFIRLFKKEMDITPIQYICQKKMEKAQLMLVTQNTPLKDIAYLLGYDNYSYFTRIFKKIVGTTPQEYKRAAIGKK